MDALILLAVLFLVIPPAAALYSFVRVRHLSEDIDRLTREVRETQRSMRSAQRAAEAAAGQGPSESASATKEPPPTETFATPTSEETTKPESASGPDVRPTTEQRMDPFVRPAARSRPSPDQARASTGDPKVAGTAPDPEPDDPRPRADQAPRTPPKSGAGSDPGASAGEAPDPARPGVDLETLIGSTWLLRVGLGILAIALALFARSVAPQLSAGAKVAVAYVASLSLFAVGKFYEDRLEKFARPVMAGGLAFGFFVAFAAHFVPAMQAVSLPVSIVWMVLSMMTVLVAAERWKSEHTAVLAIVLGHLSAQVSAGDADMYSLVMIAFLACTAIVLLLRHSWVALGVAGVGLSYGAHLLWLLAERAPIDGEAGFWLNLAFLSSYYVIFLVADVLWWRRNSEEEVDPTSRAARAARALGPTNLVLYASLTSFVYILSGAAVESIEWYFLTLGALQGVLAWLYRHSNHRDYIFYPAFGTILWTLGMFAALDALALNLVLAAQALLLLVAAHRTRLWIFHALAQAAMVAAFLQYITGIGPASATGALGLFIGGLGVGWVYLLHASLEETWYGDGSPSDWFGLDADSNPLGLLGRTFSAAMRDIAPALAPVHAVLGGVVLARESLRYFGGGPELAGFLTATLIVVLAIALVRASGALLFTVTTLAVSVTLAAAGAPSAAIGFSLTGLLLAAIAMIHRGPNRFVSREASVFLHGQGVAALALLGTFVVVHTAPTGTLWYLVWMGLPLLVLGFQYGADSIAARVLSAEDAAGAEEETAAADSVPQPPSGAALNYQMLGVAMYLACAALITLLTEQAIGRNHVAPIWIAFWACAGLVAARFWMSRGLFVTGYAVLVGGYAVLLSPFTTLNVWWAGLIVTTVPFLVAIALDQRLDETIPREEQGRWTLGLALTLLPYAIGLVVLTGYAVAQLPEEWALFGAALVSLALLLNADRLNMRRGVAAIVMAAVAWNLLLLATAEDLARPAESLLPLLLFAGATLVVERVVQAWVTEERDHPQRAWFMTGLVVLATLSAVFTLYTSEVVGPTWATAGWSVVGGSMMAIGFAAKSAVHRRVALVLLGSCIVRVFVVDTVGLSDTARIGAFLVLGLILVAIALLYTRFSEELKSWL